MSWLPPSELGVHAVEVDAWDRLDLRDTAKRVRDLQRARRKINRAAVTGTEALDDVFHLLHKANPTLVSVESIRPAFRVNHAVVTEMAQVPALRRLRALSVGDSWQSALATVGLVSLLAGLFDRLAVEQALAEKLQERYDRMIELQVEVLDAQDGFDALVGDQLTDEAIEGLQEAAEALSRARGDLEDAEASLAESEQALEDALAAQRLDLAQTVQATLERLSDDLHGLESAARACGLEPGEFRVLPAERRIALARQFATPRFQCIADLFGRVQALPAVREAEPVPGAGHEVVDLELSGDLSRVVPAELLALADPITEVDFYARLSERELLSYSMQGPEEVGRGGMVICVDGSRSMAGDREVWAHAVMLALLHQARRQRRCAHVIHFGARDEYQILSFDTPESFTAERIVEVAGGCWYGGTDFATPLLQAVTLLRREFKATGRTNSDVVFITDGMCVLDGRFLEKYLATTQRWAARTWGISVEQSVAPDEALWLMSEGRVVTVRDLRSGVDVADLFRGLAQRTS